MRKIMPGNEREDNTQLFTHTWVHLCPSPSGGITKQALQMANCEEELLDTLKEKREEGTDEAETS
jgi:hypothetical protein